ncbi:MAG TPA: hypothetical protein VNB90_01370 [Cytophagaceae bacterium]|nr:hypothetical protein [Cytophagaceae bacterium]
MKKAIYIPALVAAMLVSMSVFAIGTSNTKNKTFRHSFHHAKNVHRFDKADGFTEYDFLVKGQYISATYDNAGGLVETDFNIAYKELPAKAKEFISNEFSNPVITDITRVEYKQNVCYKVRLESNGKEYSIATTSAGEIVMGFE